MNVKHVGLRMTGLVGKVLIIDEVHAYDTYMTTIIERLLRWLSSMNTSVILLSATLPIARRKQLAEAYCKGVMLDEQLNIAYPNLLVIKKQFSEDKTVWTPSQEIKVWQPNRVIEINSLHFADDEDQVSEKAKWLIGQIRDSGCACWITNTVKRSQNIYKALNELKKETSLDIELDLIHSQFPLSNRQDKEIQLKDKYGRKGDKRPKRGIVIGTQVLEQSLDLDFDDLTMVLLAQSLAREPEIQNPVIVLVTDRVDLDEQIKKTFHHCGLEPVQAQTGKHLSKLITEGKESVITTVIDKFASAVDAVDFKNESPNLFVLVDESHRSVYGETGAKMEKVLPKACFIGFTGTPLMKRNTRQRISLVAMSNRATRLTKRWRTRRWCPCYTKAVSCCNRWINRR